jgi:hypothetical protein
MEDVTPGFGDNVRIRSTPRMQELGYAGRSGSVYGETTPSVSGVEVIGEVTCDFALNVVFDNGDPKAGLWFAPQLVEFVDHAPGTQIRIGEMHLVRRADGEWDQLGASQYSPKTGFISWLMRSFRGKG